MKLTKTAHAEADAATSKPSANETNNYGDKNDVARLASMSRRWVDGELVKGMPHMRLGSRRVRFDLAEVREWLREKYHVQRRGGV